MPPAGKSLSDAPPQRRDSRTPSIALRGRDAAFLQNKCGPGADVNELGEVLRRGADGDAFDAKTGRAALAMACRLGLGSVAQRLVEYGADPDKPDSRGWLPVEEAAFYGHMGLVRLLEGRTTVGKGVGEGAKLRAGSTAEAGRGFKDHVPWLRDQHLPAGGSHLWISLGSNDATKDTHTKPITFTDTSLDTAENQAGSCLSLHVQEKQAMTYTTALPMLGSNVNEPRYFPIHDISKVQLKWTLVKTELNGRRRLAGSSLVLLGELNARTSPLKESLVRDFTVAIQDPSTFECIAKLTFSIFSTTPYAAARPSLVPRAWDFGNGIGGHRGSGKNIISSKRLQIGENSLQSFTSAINHGASFLEFDVQLTSDLVPVIYHDLLVSETGTDAPMHTLTFEQFQQLSKFQGPRPPRKLARSNSLHSADHGYLDDLSERMTKTNFHSINGFKSNTRGNFIQESCCTLEELLKTVPPHINLNIELKYPMLFEASEWDMEPLAIKTDIFVDTILSKVYEHAPERTIVFSSFSPEICIALSAKQRTWPVFFLSKTSVECTPLVKCPRLIEYIKSTGLGIMSFGLLNSEPQCVKVQFEGGIDGVITDSVRATAQLSNLPVASSEAGRVYP